MSDPEWEIELAYHIKRVLDNAGLSDRERQAIDMIFGLNDGYGMDYDELGRKLHVTRERARQITVRALSKMVKTSDMLLPIASMFHEHQQTYNNLALAMALASRVA